MAPAFLHDQLERSRANLGLETIDVFYLHNPETQLSFVSRGQFDSRIEKAFQVMEEFVSEGKIRYYGAATWEGFRKPAGTGLSLVRMADMARVVGGDAHHFRFIQLPFNLAMTEAYTMRNEIWNGEPANVLDAAGRLGISVVASASLLQARLADGLPEPIRAQFNGASTDAARAIQFARSAPGLSVALVGMSRPEHVAENLSVARLQPLTPSEFHGLFPAAR
jgi:aryl-alcohol dehydrogenase-like predicted oxidoreductase